MDAYDKLKTSVKILIESEEASLDFDEKQLELFSEIPWLDGYYRGLIAAEKSAMIYLKRAIERIEKEVKENA